MMTKNALLVGLLGGVFGMVTNTDWLQFLGILFAAGFALAGTIITVRQSRLAAKEKDKHDGQSARLAVDAAAYERARQSYEASIANYERELGNLHRGVDHAELRAEHAERRAEHAESEALRCRVRLAQFETLLLAHKIPIPPEEPREV